ncbi:HNH endonuclease signature motif containing protein, partial [Gordonia sp. 852002-50816_SCH5313054-a]|uniref:HNH endonuclease signature motif containing protein n=1 Tax=Gordonia sp. 852002-50816_SCH5313054-a TaxID=1834091 RepID=UPI0012E95A15
RWTPGQSRLTGTVPAASGVLIDQRLTQLANSVHDADPRTHAQRRADALTAFANGDTTLACRCDTCTSPAAITADEPGADPQPSPTPMPMPVGPRAMIHVVANQSTLDGEDDQPGYLDGVGVIDADTVRELAADAAFDYLDAGACTSDPRHPDHAAAARAALRYVPSKKLLALVRSGELCCTFPGCTNPVWHADVDHSTPFDHHNPSSGGLTVRANLKPLCRFHHRTKTFGRWRDYQLDL